MERISLGFKVLQENLWLWFVALGLNLLVFFVGIITKTLKLVPPGIHLKLGMPNGIPEMSNILQQPQTHGINIDLSPAFIVFILVAPYLAGGFISSIFNILKGYEISKETFMSDCKYFYLRMLAVNILTLLLLLAAFLPALIFPPLIIVSIIFVMFYTYFWQLALIRDDLEIGEALYKGKSLFKDNLSNVLGLLIQIAVLSAIVSIPLNILGQNVMGYLFSILIWTYLGSIFVIAVISLFKDLEEKPGILD
ncbi:MAG: hypothetical protein ACOYVD_03135 [Bacillota bacterium]